MSNKIDSCDEAFVGLRLYKMKVKRVKQQISSTSTTDTAVAAAPEKPQSFERRDRMREMEVKIQQIWDSEKTFLVDATDDKKEKFFCTFPYPYMNGRLHLGHAFTVTKADFSAGYQRLKGKQVLFPFAFHCTGQPISSAALKLRRELDGELEDAADKPNKVTTTTSSTATPTPSTGEKKFKSKKSKSASKSGGADKKPSDILREIGVKDEDIPKFRDPVHWLKTFPAEGEVDLRHFGLLCDWRRSFITTNENPYYDAFIQWQFRTLYKRGKLKRGKRPTICTPDGEACADHDRADGEGVQYQEYTLIKMKVTQPPTRGTSFTELVNEYSATHEIFLVAATLRPETMFGQTNCYVLPDGEYGLYQVSPKEIFVCGEHAARNLAFQGYPSEDGTMECLGEVLGKHIVGTLVKAPLAVHDQVYILPMETVLMDIGTAVVTSVPSDSPDDFMTYKTLKESEKFRTTHSVDLDWLKHDIVHIIDIPDYGNLPAAPQECEKLKIKSPKDKDLLEKAKERVYLKGFDEGVMTAACSAVPGIPGMKVKDAKPKVRQYLLDSNQGLKYYEPQKPVISRSGSECIVKQLDQWYLPYGETEWKDLVKAHVENPATFNAYSPQALKQYEFTLSWLQEWACSRSYGLGTFLPKFTPQDKENEFVIESLSDSTIYMAYYTIAHFLQGGSYTGEAGEDKFGCRLKELTPEIMKDDRIWDYIFLLSNECPYNVETDTIGKQLLKLRKEFQFWYPLDLRVSGKDLIQNHLTMSLYNHSAIWNNQPQLWPKSFFTNGHILIENEKMSKSTGNFILLAEAIRGQKQMTLPNGDKKQIGWTADATRIALGDAGDSLENSNLVCDVADNAVMRLFSETRFAEQIVAMEDKSGDNTPLIDFLEQVFNAQMDSAIETVDLAFASMRMRDALKDGYFVLPDARDAYRKACGQLGFQPKKSHMLRFIEVYAKLIAPIAPHYSENIWRFILKNNGSIFDAGWPTVEIKSIEIRNMLIKKYEYLVQLEHKARGQIDKLIARAPGSIVNSITINIAEDVPEYHAFVCNFLKNFDSSTNKSPMNALSEIMKNDPKWKANLKDAMKIAPKLVEAAQIEGVSAYETKSSFNEVDLLNLYSPLLAKLLEIPAVEIKIVAPDVSLPGKPSINVVSTKA